MVREKRDLTIHDHPGVTSSLEDIAPAGIGVVERTLGLESGDLRTKKGASPLGWSINDQANFRELFDESYLPNDNQVMFATSESDVDSICIVEEPSLLRAGECQDNDIFLTTLESVDCV